MGKSKDKKEPVKAKVVKAANYVYGACYKNHPQLKIGGGVLVGGNCGSPVIKDADVYIGLDSAAYRPQTVNFPWVVTKKSKKKYDFCFPIVNMGVPEDVKNFKLMINWIVDQLANKATVHVGCIGGHGRTGLVLVAVAASIHKKEPLEIENNEVIQWVRKNFCHKAVESTEQVRFLKKHYGVATDGVYEPMKLRNNHYQPSYRSSLYVNKKKDEGYWESTTVASFGSIYPDLKSKMRLF